jgi:hypothetical protein
MNYKKTFLRIIRIILITFVLAFLLNSFASYSLAQDLPAQQIKTSGEAKALRVAPGELLPISVKLLNFGAGTKVDVTISYQILDADGGQVKVNETETVAVQTTASFIKNIQIPNDLPPGRYIATSNIVYAGQEVPATSKFEFTVENKIAGIFVSQLMLYGGFTLFIGLIFAIISHLIIKGRISRLAIHEYSQVSKPSRIYYEMVSDMIMQMHNSVGDKAYEMADTIDGLSIDKDTGKVLNINKDPSEIVSLLLVRYQNLFGKKLKILPRVTDKEIKENMHPVEDNLNIIKKYFRQT